MSTPNNVVKQIKRATRRKFTADEKIRIVLEGLRGEIPISELCRREGIAASIYYKWSKAFLEAGKNGLTRTTLRDATSDEVKHLKKEYGIKTSKQPHARSAKRITILISTAFLGAGGSVHRVQCLKSALYRHCKAKKLDCDALAMEANTHSYISKRKGKGGKSHTVYGQKLYSNEFLDWSICVTATATPKAELFANIITDHLAQEEIYDEEQELPGDRQREGDFRNTRHKEGRFRKVKEARLTLR